MIEQIFFFADAAVRWQFGFQDPATPIMEGIINLHHEIMFFVVIVVIFVIWMLIRIVLLFSSDVNKKANNISHGTLIEIVWTITPGLILIVIAIPSFALLYSMDEVIDPSVTIKAIGHQWYWSYEYSDYSVEEPIAFDSYMIPEEELELGSLRLLEVDNRVVVPVNTHIRVIATSTDVIHSWAVPSLGVKIDTVPGRLNQTSFYLKRTGVFYGQCSEICGVNHGFMPIVIEGVSMEDYINWVEEQM